MEQKTLWHRRLGHAPVSSLKIIPGVPNVLNDTAVKDCSIFPLAKQTRLSFLVSTSVTKSCFQLLHTDVWGPYRVPLMMEKSIS